MLLNFKMLQAQSEIEAEKSRVANYNAYEYDKLIPNIIKVTSRLNLRIKPTFDMSFNEGKPVISCKVDVINLDVLITKKTNEVSKHFMRVRFMAFIQLLVI